MEHQDIASLPTVLLANASVSILSACRLPTVVDPRSSGSGQHPEPALQCPVRAYVPLGPDAWCVYGIPAAIRIDMFTIDTLWIRVPKRAELPRGADRAARRQF